MLQKKQVIRRQIDLFAQDRESLAFWTKLQHICRAQRGQRKLELRISEDPPRGLVANPLCSSNRLEFWSLVQSK